ncbi:MAG: FixH family protein [Bacteroidetes bacterium]|nr:FixH family protein [Bacteroidota bacterium]
MKIKYNWGFGIVVTIVLFGIGTFVMVYISMSTNVDLVTEDYYEKELRYEEHIRLVKSTNALVRPVSMEITQEYVTFTFPIVDAPEKYSGTVFFFRPSNKRGDFVRNVSVDTSYVQQFNLNDFTPGLWRAKMSWNVGSQQFYSEMPIIIQ